MKKVIRDKLQLAKVLLEEATRELTDEMTTTASGTRRDALGIDLGVVVAVKAALDTIA